MIKLSTQEVSLVSGGSYFTQEEYAETLRNWGLVPAVMFASTCGIVAYSLKASGIALLGTVGAGAVLGYLGGSYMGAELNSDPNSTVLRGVFVDTYRT